MKNRILASVAVTVVAAMSLGSSCDKVGESLNNAGGLSRLGIGDSRSDAAVQAGTKVGSAVMMSDDEKRLIGEAVATSLVSSPGLVTDEALNIYVNKVGLTLAHVAGRNDMDFSFAVLNDEKVNAISAPYGYVFITRGALKQMKDESELAGVLAHEIAHVIKDHGIDAIKTAKLTDAGMDLFNATNRNNWAGLGAPHAAKFFNGVIYSQGQESDADAEAIKLLKSAGYDPTGLERFLQRAGGGDKLFSSHPPLSGRVDSLRKAAGGATGQKLPERFASNVK